MTRSERIANTERYIARQVKIVKGFQFMDMTPSPRQVQPHRMAKVSAATCGNKNCVMCQNPRKRGELTIQEKRLHQRMDDE